MSLHAAAQHLSDKGRGRDTTLVHMSPREVQGLQALAKAQGGSLTINPSTGLVEAGFLEQVLPIVAAAAATYFTAGAAAPAIAGALGSAGMGAAAAGTAGGILAGAGSGALISGGVAAAQGKDVGKAALMGGLGGAVAGGMGAYGDASTFAADAASKTGTGAVVDGAVQGSGTAATGAPAGFVPSSTPMPPPTAAGNAAAALPEGAARNAALERLAQSTGTLAEGSASLPGQGLSAAPGIGAPPGLTPSYYSNLPADSYLQKAGIQALPAAGLLQDEKQNVPMTPEEESKLRRISPNFRAQSPVQPNPYYNAQYPSFAQGGLAALQGGGPVERMTQMNTAMNPQGGLYPQGMIDKTQYATPTQRPTSLEVVESEPSYDARVNPITGTLMAAGGQAKEKKQRADLTPESNLSSYDPFSAALANVNNARNKAYMTAATMPPAAIKTLGGIPTAAGGGLADLGGYSDGGRLLKGPGDGMSDNIPATIGRKQPARLADGEFVVPADVVSHLGNGSTDAGAKRLYDMMSKVRSARTGKKKQAPAVNTAKLMPA